MTDYGMPFINDKNLFAAAMQARLQIADYNELPSAAIAQAAARFKVNEADVGYYAAIAVAWTMAMRTLRRGDHKSQEPSSTRSHARGVGDESILDLGD